MRNVKFLGLLALLHAGTALAQDFPPELLTKCNLNSQTCTKGNFKQTQICKMVAIDYCPWLKSHAAEEYAASLDKSKGHTGVPPAELGSGPAWIVDAPPAQPPTYDVSNDGGSYLARLNASQGGQRQGEYSDAKTLAWNASGPAVGSCEEYTYEKRWDYSRFHELVGRYGGDARAMFAAAYDASVGIAYRELRDKGGKPIEQVEFPMSAFKNAYFGFETKNPFGTYSFDADVAQALATGKLVEHRIVPDWDWHAEMGLALQPVNDDVLYAYDAQKAGFMELVRERNHALDLVIRDRLKNVPEWRRQQILDAIFPPGGEMTSIDFVNTVSLSGLAAAAYVPELVSLALEKKGLKDKILAKNKLAAFSFTVPDGIYQDTCSPPAELNLGELDAKLYTLDCMVDQALQAALAEGCLDLDAPTACDWSPALFAGFVDRKFSGVQERDYQECRAFTGDDFAPGASIHAPPPEVAKYLPDAGDHATSPERVKKYVDAYRLYVASLPVEKGPDGKPVLGWFKRDKGTIGNADVRADWEYDIGAGFQLGADAICDTNLDVHAMLHTSAAAMGKSFELLDTNHYVKTEADKVKAHSHFKVVGVPLYTPYDDAKGLIQLDLAEGGTQDEAKTGKTIFIGPIPITFSIGMHVAALYKLKLGLGIGRTCNATQKSLDLGGTVTLSPSADVKLFASVAAGIDKAQAGIKADLTVAHVAAPFSASATVKVDPQKGVWADLGTRLDISQRYLDGKIALFVKVIVEIFSQDIFTWRGFGGDANAFDESISIPLAGLGQ